nr:MAG TPA: hypothetical protein [Caudoviricetes sp.]
MFLNSPVLRLLRDIFSPCSKFLFQARDISRAYL